MEPLFVQKTVWIVLPALNPRPPAASCLVASESWHSIDRSFASWWWQGTRLKWSNLLFAYQNNAQPNPYKHAMVIFFADDGSSLVTSRRRHRLGHCYHPRYDGSRVEKSDSARCMFW
jgi:hypothetical protein